MNDTNFIKQLFFVNALIPGLLILWDLWQGSLGANPIEFVTRSTGVLALLFVVLTLCVTPLRNTLKWNWLLKHRRMLGLFAFFYALAHFLTYIAFDRDWKFLSVPADVIKRPFITLGMLSFLMMIPLAATSTNLMIKKLGGKNWNRLHWLTYAIAVLATLHYYWLVKSDVTYPALFAGLVCVLLVFRLLQWLGKMRASL